MTISEWIENIVTTHHAFLKEELPRLRILLEKETGKHEQDSSWNLLIKNFLGLKHELEIHLAKEEMMVFPSFRHLEECSAAGTLPDLKRYDIRESLSQMQYEHDATHDYLEVISKAAADARLKTEHRDLFERLQRLKKDLEEHIEKEEKSLFPAAQFLYAELTQNLLREE